MTQPKFLLQERTDEVRDIWVAPQEYSDLPNSADQVSVLREAIQKHADRQTWNWWEHYRIVTSKGKAVERWKTKPGIAKKTRRIS